MAGVAPPPPERTIVDSPTWAERVEEREAEARDLSSSSESGEGHEVPVPTAAPTRSAQIARPALQARDFIMAVRDLTYLAQAAVLVPTPMQRFTTDLSPSELGARMEWLG